MTKAEDRKGRLEKRRAKQEQKTTMTMTMKKKPKRTSSNEKLESYKANFGKWKKQQKKRETKKNEKRQNVSAHDCRKENF